MAEAAAVRRVRAEGYDCDPQASGLSCARTVTRNLVITCVERIELALDDTSLVTGVRVPPAACFGGFG